MNGLLVSTAIVVTALLIVRSVQWIGRKLRHARERKAWRTVLRNTCPTCKRVEKYGEIPFDADLGWHFDNRFNVCSACVYAAHGRIEFDTDAWTLDAVRRLDPDFKESDVPIPHGPAHRSAFSTGAHIRTAE